MVEGWLRKGEMREGWCWAFKPLGGARGGDLRSEQGGSTSSSSRRRKKRSRSRSSSVQLLLRLIRITLFPDSVCVCVHSGKN